MKILGFSVVIFPENTSYTSWCPQLDIASQGKTAKAALANLKEAIELHLGCLGAPEITRLKRQVAPKIVTKTLRVPLPC